MPSNFSGKKHSQESRLKMSHALSGKNHPNYGKRLPKSTREKISRANTGYKQSKERIENHRQKLLGRKTPIVVRIKQSLAVKGSKSYRWKGGITKLVMAVRGCFKYRQWRSDVFTRDNFICVKCGDRRGGNLNADHYPKMFSQIFSENKITSIEQAEACEEFWNINNGRTLCEKCHQEHHNGSNPR